MSELAFPKPRRIKKKPTREQDPDYVRWVHTWACCVPGCGKRPVHAHHVVPRGRGGSDRTCIPLCMAHHTGVYGIHVLGQITWSRTFSVDLMEQVEKFQDLYAKGAKGPY